MSIARIVRNTVVRRLTLLLLAAVLTWAGIGKASAQTVNDTDCANGGIQGSSGSPSPLCSSRQTAYSGAVARQSFIVNSNPSGYSNGPIEHVCVDANWCRYRVRIIVTATGGYSSQDGYRWYAKANECPGGGSWSEAAHMCSVPCSSRGDLGATWVMGNSQGGASSICEAGCLFRGDLEDAVDQTKVDGVFYTKYSSMSPWGTSCTIGGEGDGDGTTQTPPSDSDADGSSDGNDSAPNNPGQSGGSEDGSGTDNNNDGDESDDGEGSGNGNTSGGGGNCSSPPSSTGDAIAAQIAYQTWATRCAIEGAKDGGGALKVKVEGGTGGGVIGGGTGNGACADDEVNGVICAIKTAIDGIKGFIDGLTGEAGTLDTSEGETEEPESVWADQSGETLDLDSSGFGLAGGSCPAPPTYMGYSLDLGGNMCLFATIIGAIVMVAAYAQAAYIIGRA